MKPLIVMIIYKGDYMRSSKKVVLGELEDARKKYDEFLRKIKEKDEFLQECISSQLINVEYTKGDNEGYIKGLEFLVTFLPSQKKIKERVKEEQNRFNSYDIKSEGHLFRLGFNTGFNTAIERYG